MMIASEEKRRTKPTGSRPALCGWHLRRIALNWPLFSWIGLAGLCVILYVRTIQYGIVTAAAQVVQQEVAPLETAASQILDIREHRPAGQQRTGIGAIAYDVYCCANCRSGSDAGHSARHDGRLPGGDAWAGQDGGR